MGMTIRIVPVLFAFLLFALPVAAQQSAPLNPDRNVPLEVTADETLEWHREDNQFIAKGNALAEQGDVSIAGDILTADYRETNENSTEIWRLTSAGNVIVKSETNTAYGDRAVYDLDRGVAVMTGEALKMVSPEQTVTARESFEYWIADGRLKAIGGARVIRPQDTLEADTITATFQENAQGERKLKTIVATGHVVITTRTEVLTGDRGIYRASSNIAELNGNVKIRRGDNVLEGQRAEVNLTTNISKMFGGSGTITQGGDGRVRGVFYPGSEKKNQ